MATLNMLSRILVIIGALNWGLVWAFKMDLVQMLLGMVAGLPMVVYILVGVAGVYEAVRFVTNK